MKEHKYFFCLNIRMGNAEVSLSNKLQVIATIQPGYTLAVKTMTVVAHDAWGMGLSRWWHAESRIQTMNWIDDVTNQAVDMLKLQFTTQIWQDLKAAQAGIRHLEKTYAGDNDIQQRIAKAVARIDEIEKQYPSEVLISAKPGGDEKKSSANPAQCNSTQDSGRTNDCSIKISTVSSMSVGDTINETTKIPAIASVKQLHDVDSNTSGCQAIQGSASPVANPQPLPIGRSYKDALLTGEEKKKYAFYPGQGFGPDPAQYLRRLGQGHGSSPLGQGPSGQGHGSSPLGQGPSGQGGSRPRPIPKMSTAQGSACSHTYPHEYIRGFSRFPHLLTVQPPVIR
jgi:hypothetical protein